MTITATNTTVLFLQGMGVPAYSARGLHQTLEPIDAAAHLERSINGGLIDFSYAPFRKYKSTITGGDQRPPAVDGVWPGTLLSVDCISELSIVDEYGQPVRPVVDGSLKFEAGFWRYRPRLQMVVMGFALDQDEYGAQISWTLELEEA